MSGNDPDGYTGIDNLEVMQGAVRYLRFLNDSIAELAGPPATAGSLVDFGAGAGTHTLDLRDRGYQVDCIEIDPTLQERLQAQGLTVVASPDQLTPGSYSLAYSMNVLEHIDDDVAAVRGLTTLLRPGSRVLIYVPAFQILYSAMDTKVGHVRRYRRGQLMETVRSAGLTVDSCRYVDSLGFAAALVYKVIGSKDGDLDEGSVRFYDRFVFPVSRVLDKVVGRIVGKNLLLTASVPHGDGGPR